MKNNQNEKTKVRKNSALKNAFIAYGAVFKRYPASPIILVLYIICRVIIPITYTIIPATAIRGITSGDLHKFLVSVGLVLLAVLFLNMLAGITNAYLQGYRLFTRSGVHMINFFKKSITTGYMNIEPEPKHGVCDFDFRYVQLWYGSFYAGLEDYGGYNWYVYCRYLMPRMGNPLFR